VPSRHGPENDIDGGFLKGSHVAIPFKIEENEDFEERA
jgi:hypothetical protein